MVGESERALKERVWPFGRGMGMRRLRAEGEAGCGLEEKEGIGLLERFVVGGGWEGRSWIEEGRACAVGEEGEGEVSGDAGVPVKT